MVLGEKAERNYLRDTILSEGSTFVIVQKDKMGIRMLSKILLIVSTRVTRTSKDKDKIYTSSVTDCMEALGPSTNYPRHRCMRWKQVVGWKHRTVYIPRTRQ